MTKIGCLYCQDKKRSYYWSGASINVVKEIFYGSYLPIVQILEEPWRAERYPKEEVIQCDQCNAVWHIDYFFPDRPPFHVNAEVIPEKELPEFLTKIGKRLADAYKPKES